MTRFFGCLVVACIAAGLLIVFVEQGRDRDRDRKVTECLESGGYPDRYGRSGRHVVCYERPPR